MKSLIVAAAFIASVQAGLRFGCSSLTIQRLDPVVQPGSNPSSHLHHIVGGNQFNASMNGDVGARASCTTCQMSEDFSNYWTAVMYFKHANGSYHRVPVVNNAALASGTTGGITVYYTPYDLSKDNLKSQPITTFKPGFRMTVGSPTSTAADGAKHVGLSYNCLTTLLNRGAEMRDFPTKACKAGIFVTHHFPACWNGKDLDSPDHQSHMYNTIRNDGFTNAGPCPTTHPIRVPQVVYETVWDTTQFASMWPADGKNPFVWSFEGSSGYGTHADYMFGWKGDALDRAMAKSECFYDGCGAIKKQDMSAANKCSVPDMVGDKIDGWVSHLPGMAN